MVSLQQSQVEIRVEGTIGKPFSGSFMTGQGAGSSSVDVNGQVPARYYTHGEKVSVFVQKHSRDGMLLVSIYRDGIPVRHEFTGDAYGVVTFAVR